MPHAAAKMTQYAARRPAASQRNATYRIRCGRTLSLFIKATCGLHHLFSNQMTLVIHRNIYRDNGFSLQHVVAIGLCVKIDFLNFGAVEHPKHPHCYDLSYLKRC